MKKTSDQEMWAERINPLIGLSIRQAQLIYDSARGPGSPLLQRIYDEIEAADPTLMTCVERRASALCGLGWRISAKCEEDPGLADEERAASEEFFKNIENLAAAIEHLEQAFFRGYAHVQPLREADGSVKNIQLLKSWNFLRAPGGEWLWNPDCHMGPAGLESCEGAGLVTVDRPRHIDYPVMSIYIRHALGERDWGRYLERYAIPKPAVKMHQGATEQQRGDYVKAATDAEDGRPSVWPFGCEIVDFAAGSRGQDPFTAFVNHQEKMIVLMATGGTLTSLAEAGSGTLAGNAHMDVWREIVGRDADIIGEAINRYLLRPYLLRCFPGRQICAAFKLGEDAEPDPADLFELNAKAYAGGLQIDPEELTEKTGYKLREVRQPDGTGFGGFYAGGNAAQGTTPLQNAVEPLQNDPATASEPMLAPGEKPAGTILGAFRDDVSKANYSVLGLINSGLSREAAGAVAQELPGMVPRNLKTAELIEKEMAETFAGGAGK